MFSASSRTRRVFWCFLVDCARLICAASACSPCVPSFNLSLSAQQDGDLQRATESVREALRLRLQPFVAAAPSACRMCTTTCASHRDGRSRAHPMTLAAACSLTHNKRSLLSPRLLTHRLSLPLCAQAAAAGRQRHMSQQVTCHNMSHVTVFHMCTSCTPLYSRTNSSRRHRQRHLQNRHTPHAHTAAKRVQDTEDHVGTLHRVIMCLHCVHNHTMTRFTTDAAGADGWRAHLFT